MQFFRTKHTLPKKQLCFVLINSILLTFYVFGASVQNTTLSLEVQWSLCFFLPGFSYLETTCFGLSCCLCRFFQIFYD